MCIDDPGVGFRPRFPAIRRAENPIEGADVKRLLR